MGPNDPFAPASPASVSPSRRLLDLDDPPAPPADGDVAASAPPRGGPVAPWSAAAARGGSRERRLMLGFATGAAFGLLALAVGFGGAVKVLACALLGLGVAAAAPLTLSWADRLTDGLRAAARALSEAIAAREG